MNAATAEAIILTINVAVDALHAITYVLIAAAVILLVASLIERRRARKERKRRAINVGGNQGRAHR